MKYGVTADYHTQVTVYTKLTSNLSINNLFISLYI